MTMDRYKFFFARFLVLLTFAAASSVVQADARIKDLVNIKGVRDNQLIGFGLVVGLKGSGDSGKVLSTQRAVASMLTRLGIQTSPEETAAGNLASVIVTADLPAFARIGDRLDVRISTVGDAKSLAGGTLVQTMLRAGDNRVFAVAQGAVAVGTASGEGAQVLTVARVPQGASVEREFSPEIAPQGVISLSLKQADFTTNSRIAERINGHFKGFYARSVDRSTIEVKLPPLLKEEDVVDFVAQLEGLRVAVDSRSVVVLNERTGTIVMGSEVAIGKITISHGDLTIQVAAEEQDRQDKAIPVPGSTVGKLVEALNALGVRPADLIGILQAVHAAGALQADLKFI